MMKEYPVETSSYRVPYHQCKLHFEKLNYICLDPHCHQSSLICSLCKDQLKHSKHLVRPLKFYLQQLQQKYQQSSQQSPLDSLLQELQASQYKFYQKLQKSVQQIAEAFRVLEQSVTEQINHIRNQIYQEIAKRNSFNHFYDSLKKGDIEHTNFLIQNYLPQATIGKISNLQNLDTLTLNVCSLIQQAQSQIVTRKIIDSFTQKEQNHEALNYFNFKTALKRPSNIIYENNLLTQTQILPNAKSLCLIDFPVLSISGKLTFKIVQLKKASQFIIGVAPKQIYESMNELWNPAKLNQNCFVIASDGNNNKGWVKNEITQFGQGSTLELYYRNGQLKIGQKNKTCSAKMPTDIDLFVFLVLVGDTQVKINHLK